MPPFSPGENPPPPPPEIKLEPPGPPFPPEELWPPLLPDPPSLPTNAPPGPFRLPLPPEYRKPPPPPTQDALQAFPPLPPKPPPPPAEPLPLAASEVPPAPPCAPFSFNCTSIRFDLALIEQHAAQARASAARGVGISTLPALRQAAFQRQIAERQQAGRKGVEPA